MIKRKVIHTPVPEIISDIPTDSNIPHTPMNTFEAAFVVIVQHYWQLLINKVGTDGTTREALVKNSPAPMNIKCLIKDAEGGGRDTLIEMKLTHAPEKAVGKNKNRKA